MAHSEDVDERKEAVEQLYQDFADLPDKERATKEIFELTKDIFALTKDEDIDVRSIAVYTLGLAFPHVTDKEESWKNLLALTKDKDEFVRSGAIYALKSAFSHVINKDAASKDFLALTKNEDICVQSYALFALESAFPYIIDKDAALKDLLALTKDKDNNVRSYVAPTLGSAFPHVTDKAEVLKVLMALTKDKDLLARSGAALAFGSVFPHITDKAEVRNVLMLLTKDKDKIVRLSAKRSLFNIAQHFLKEKNYEKTFKYFYCASTKSMLREYINPDSFYYLCRGFGSYYHGRTIINELSNIENPKEYTKSLKEAVRFFVKSNKYIEKSDDDRYDTDFFPICLNIFSAYYEYRLSSKKLDAKRIAKVQKYLDEASKQCRIIGTEKGERIVKTFEKLAEALTSRLKEIELETEKNKVSGIGKKAEYEPFVDKSREDFEKHIVELENLLDEIELPIIKEIAEHERIKLDKLKPDKAEKSEPTNRKLLKAVKLLLTISLGMLTFSYTVLDYMGYPTARMYSLIIFGIAFIISLIIYLIKR